MRVLRSCPVVEGRERNPRIEAKLTQRRMVSEREELVVIPID